MLKKKRRIGIAIDMTPRVEVAFLLLIFVVCATQFKLPEKDKITLPEPHSEAKSPESQIVTLSLPATPSVRLIHRKGGEEQQQDIAPEALKTDLTGWPTAARSANPSARVIVKMDKNAPYGIMA